MVRKGKLVWSEKWFDQGLKQDRQESQQEALQQGRQEGRQEGQLEVLLQLARRRFGDSVADTVRVGVTAMREPTALSELVDWLLDCDTVDAFLARLKRA